MLRTGMGASCAGGSCTSTTVRPLTRARLLAAPALVNRCGAPLRPIDESARSSTPRSCSLSQPRLTRPGSAAETLRIARFSSTAPMKMSIAVTGALCAAAVTTAALARQADDPQPRRDPGRVPLGLLGHLPELGGVGRGHEGDGRAHGRVRHAAGHARAGPGGSCSRPTRRSTRSASSSTASTAIRSCSATSTRATRRSPAASSASAPCSPSSTPRRRGSRPSC